MANPIKYSDLVVPDGAITQLITQLQTLDQEYAKAVANIRAEATKLAQELKGVSGATEEGRKVTKAAATDADRLAKAQERLRQAQSENALELEKVNQAIQEARSLTKLQAKLNNSAEGSFNRLSAQYSINQIRLKKMTDAEREATEEGRKLEAETKELFEKMKRFDESIGKHQLNVGNYPDMTNAIDNLGNKLLQVIGLDNDFGRSLLKMSSSAKTATDSFDDLADSGEGITDLAGDMAEGGDGIMGVFQGIGGGAKALGKTLLGLLANPVFLAIAGIAAAGASFKWWYDYNVGLVEATRLTQQFTQKTGGDLKNFRNEVQIIADTFGKDFQEVLIATNAVSKQFGISQNEALNLVRDGFIAGGDANGEFLDTLREYPAYFREAGLSAEEFIAITSQTATSGIYSDKGVDAIKEANIRLREMTKSTADALNAIGISSDAVQKSLQDGSKTTFDVMQEVSAKLAEMPESASEVGTAIADIFGGPGEDAGYQYLATLKDIDTSMDALMQKSGELGDVQRRQMESQLELQNAVNALFDRTGGTFETMIGNAKIFVNQSLTKLIKGVIKVINYFIDWYNNVWLLRYAVANVTNTIQFLFSTVFELVGMVVRQIGSLGTILKGLWKGIIGEGWDEFHRGLYDFAHNIPNTLRNMANDAADTVTGIFEDSRKKIKPLEIPAEVVVDDSAVSGAGASSSSKSTAGASKTSGGPSTEDVYKKELAARRQREDAERELIADEWEKKREELIARYEREIEDLQYYLNTEKTISEQERKNINETIVALQNRRRQDMAELFAQEAEDAIAQEKRRVDAQMSAFDMQQELEALEFELLETSEERKTRFRLEQEKKRWQKVLEINKNMTDAERAIVEKNIELIEKMIRDSYTTERTQDIYGVLGFDLTDKQKDAINSVTDYVTSAIDEVSSARAEAANNAVSQAEKEVAAAEKALEMEMQARANGYASNVEQAQKELDLAKKTQAAALREQKKAQREQQAMNTLQQVSDLITASAKVWSQLGFPSAIPAIATMWGSFAYSKIKARQLTERYGEGTVELLKGGSHASGRDIDLGTKPDGTRRRAEGGEFFAVINKRNSRKYRGLIPQLINSLNDGTFEQYMSAFNKGDSLNINVSTPDNDIRMLGKDVRAIRNQGERREVSDGRARIVYYKNLKRKVV